MCFVHNAAVGAIDLLGRKEAKECCECVWFPHTCRISILLPDAITEFNKPLLRLHQPALVLLTANGRPAHGCHLHQSAETITTSDDLQFHDFHLDDYGSHDPSLDFKVLLGDWSSLPVGRSPDAPVVPYGGWWFLDNPGSSSEREYDFMSVWFQAQVYVEEAPEVQTWWGGSMTARKSGTKYQFSASSWTDAVRNPPTPQVTPLKSQQRPVASVCVRSWQVVAWAIRKAKR